MKTIRRRNRAFSFSEMMVTTFVVVSLTSSATVVMVTSMRGFQNSSEKAYRSRNTRQSMEELQYQIRGANKAIASRTLNGTTYTSSSTTAVLTAPAYDSTQTDLVVSGVTDYVALSYNSTNKTVVETVVPGTGSQRPAQNSKVLAKDVTSFTVSYGVREIKTTNTGTTSGGNMSFTLSGTPTATPTCKVDGVTSAVTWSAGSKTVTIASPSSSGNIQFRYNVSPTTNSGADLSYVSTVDINMTCTTKNGNGVNTSQNLQCSSRFRNLRT